MQVAIWMEGCQGDSAPSPGVQMLQVFVNSSCIGAGNGPYGGCSRLCPMGWGICGGGSVGITCGRWVPPAWRMCPCATLKWSFSPCLGAVTWEDPAGG